MDGSPPGLSVHGILQARILEWVAIAFSLIHMSTPISFMVLDFFFYLWTESGKDNNNKVSLGNWSPVIFFLIRDFKILSENKKNLR